MIHGLSSFAILKTLPPLLFRLPCILISTSVSSIHCLRISLTTPSVFIGLSYVLISITYIVGSPCSPRWNIASSVHVIPSIAVAPYNIRPFKLILRMLFSTQYSCGISSSTCITCLAAPPCTFNFCSEVINSINPPLSHFTILLF